MKSKQHKKDITRTPADPGSNSILAPMLATLADKPFDDQGWLYEVKWDGYRALAQVRKDNAELVSRDNQSFSKKFYPLQQALASLQIDAVLDGEIVLMSEEGLTGFSDLQQWQSEADGIVRYFVFDLLWQDGQSLMHLPLSERRDRLYKLLPAHPLLHISQAFEGAGHDFYEAARSMQMEGIMAKKADSPYTPGQRSREWLKIKIQHRHEVVIGGYIPGTHPDDPIESLLAGVYEKEKLKYTGLVSAGLSRHLKQQLHQQFTPLISEKNPFTGDISLFPANAVWLRPKLVGEVSYTELSPDGMIISPSFRGMRVDKKPRDVKRPVAKEVGKLVKK